MGSEFETLHNQKLFIAYLSSLDQSAPIQLSNHMKILSLLVLLTRANKNREVVSGTIERIYNAI